MSGKAPNFFKHLEEAPPPPPQPKIPLCMGIDCFEAANPAWRDGDKVFCRDCAPPELKRPAAYRNED